MTNSTTDSGMLVSYYTLRKAIGWLGMLLPFILIIGNYLINELHILNSSFFIRKDCFPAYDDNGSLKSSISHFYYSTVGELFTGTMSAVALFMFCYKGHPLREGEKGLSDNALTNLAAIFALGVVVFPTSSASCISDNLRTFVSSDNTGYIHFTMATLFFICLSLMCMVNFRRTGDKVSFGKNKEHKTFMVCGIAMLVCIALIAIYSIFFEKNYPGLARLKPIFFLEAIALIFFGISWLIKGKTDFNFIPKLFMSKK